MPGGGEVKRAGEEKGGKSVWVGRRAERQRQTDVEGDKRLGREGRRGGKTGVAVGGRHEGLDPLQHYSIECLRAACGPWRTWGMRALGRCSPILSNAYVRYESLGPLQPY